VISGFTRYRHQRWGLWSSHPFGLANYMCLILLSFLNFSKFSFYYFGHGSGIGLLKGPKPPYNKKKHKKCNNKQASLIPVSCCVSCFEQQEMCSSIVMVTSCLMWWSCSMRSCGCMHSCWLVMAGSTPGVPELCCCLVWLASSVWGCP